jgi:tRNA modification GTPase
MTNGPSSPFTSHPAFVFDRVSSNSPERPNTLASRPGETIAALASAPGPAPRGIVRISGEGALTALTSFYSPEKNRDWPPRRASSTRGTLQLKAFQVPVPAQAAVWPTHRSYTGEPLVEIHTVGSPPLLEALLDEIYRCGVRPARPGEFTMRAFLSGRIDLTQAEGVLGVIDADGQAELEAALGQLAGGLSQRLGPVRSDLMDLLADLEAGLDFVDEDIEFVSQEAAHDRLGRAETSLRNLLQQATDRMQTSGRRQIVLAGLPNAGKSTLFNALAGHEAAIVSPLAGTTRDWLRATMDWDGLAIELVDTAGWEMAEGDVGVAAQSQRADQVRRADLVLWCRSSGVSAAEFAEDDARRADLIATGVPVLDVLTKADLTAGSPPPAADRTSVAISAAHSIGLDELKQAIRWRVASGRDRSGEILGSTAARCRESLAAALDALDRARVAVSTQLGDELIALELRGVLHELARILGVVYTDDILDRLFSRFCIGK